MGDFSVVLFRPNFMLAPYAFNNTPETHLVGLHSSYTPSSEASTCPWHKTCSRSNKQRTMRSCPSP
jgi:hypothetical protein